MFLLTFSDNPTSSTELCSLYCKIQLYLGSECIPLTTTTSFTTTTTTATTATTTTTTTLLPCPIQYEGDPEMELLCQLWLQWQVLQQQFNSNPSLSTAVLSPVSCLYRQVQVHTYSTLGTLFKTCFLSCDRFF